MQSSLLGFWEGEVNRTDWEGPSKAATENSLIPKDVPYLKGTENVLFSIVVILQEYVDWFAWRNSEFSYNFIHLCFQTWSQCAFLIVVTKIRNTSSQNKHSKKSSAQPEKHKIQLSSLNTIAKQRKKKMQSLSFIASMAEDSSDWKARDKECTYECYTGRFCLFLINDSNNFLFTYIY